MPLALVDRYLDTQAGYFTSAVKNREGKKLSYGNDMSEL